jgi:tRNA dimethylallyltransferase
LATKHCTVIIVCGPTASGKSDFAMSLAEKMDGVIINADSAQVYKGLPVLTSAPTIQDQKKIEHLLYNFLELKEKFCVALYLEKAANTVKEVITSKKTPIIVGGSGLYVSTLLRGINHIPQIDSEILDSLQEEMLISGTAKVYEKLMNVDAAFASKINSKDSYRILRGYGVFLQSGRTLSSFLTHSRQDPLSAYEKKVILLHPVRHFLYEVCNKRFDVMLGLGAMEEVQAIKNLKDESFLQNAARVIGFKELLLCLNGKMHYQDAVTLAKQNTRRYAKRQITWFSNQIADKQILRYENFAVLKNIANNFQFLH